MKLTTTTDRARKSYAAHAIAPPMDGDRQSKYTDTEWVATEDIDFDRLRRCIGSAFTGTETVGGEPFTRWATSHLFDPQRTEQSYTLDDQRDALTFGVGFPIWDILMNKHESLVVACQTKGPLAPVTTKVQAADDETNKYACAVVIQEYDPKKVGSWWRRICSGFRMFQAFWKMARTSKIPALYAEKKYKQDQQYYHNKLDNGVLGPLKKAHKQDGPQQVHWYVFMVGVHPDYHGQGYGRLLLEETNRLADEQNVIQYLECGVSKVGFYEKMGYKVHAQKKLVDPVDPKTNPSLDAYVMIRHPESVEVAGTSD